MNSEKGEKFQARHYPGTSTSIHVNSVAQSWSGLYASAFGNLIQIVQSSDFGPVATLSGVHKVSVTILRFEPPGDFNENGETERLASVDESGLVVIWARLQKLKNFSSFKGNPRMLFGLYFCDINPVKIVNWRVHRWCNIGDPLPIRNSTGSIGF